MSVDRREFVRASVMLTAGAAAAPLLEACRLESRRELADNGFVQLRDKFFREQLVTNPVTSTYLGGEGYDASLGHLNGRLRDYSAGVLAAEARELLRVDRSHDAIDAALLTPAHRIDHALMDAQLAFLRSELDRRYYERAVDTYVAEPFRGIDSQIQQMTPLPQGRVGDEGEWRLVVTRLSGIPPYLAIARANLEAGLRSGNMPDRRMVQRDGVTGSRANAAYFRTLPTLAKRYLGDQKFGGSMLSGIAGAGETAARGYEEFAGWLSKTFPLNETVDRFALGDVGYQRRVRTIFRDERSTADLYEHGARQVDEYTQRIADVAARLGRERGISLPFSNEQDRAWSIRRVLDDLAQQAPSSDEELLQWYRETGARAVEYGRERGIFDVPEDYKLDILPTTPVLRSTIDAAYYPAPPLKKTGAGRFYLTPTGNDPAALRENPRASVADTAVHEGFPGHDWHYRFMKQHGSEISNIRWLTPGSVEDSSAMWCDSMATEGWALYAEELMAEPAPGRPHGFYSDAEYLYELQGQLLRAARVRIDVGLHTGRMSFDEAMNYYTERVSFFPGACSRASHDATARVVCENALRAVYRYSKWPTQAITYNLGKNAIIALREAYRSRKGSAFSPREFHERFMRMGPVPPGFFRDAFLAG